MKKTFMKRFSVLLCALLFCLCTFAQHRSEQEAMQIAQEFFAKKAKKKSLQLSVVSQQKLSQQQQKRAKSTTTGAGCYVVNDEANNRFVIVSADERMYKILGYSDNGVFDAEKAPVALLEIISGYNETYDFILFNAGKLDIVAKGMYGEIQPMITSKWGQTYPFNADCPVDPRLDSYSDAVLEAFGLDRKSVTGCVATAMAQVMNYHKYPEVGQGSLSYYTGTSHTFQSMDFSTNPFDWDDMANIYGDGDYTEGQKKAVSNLMQACGISVVMDYGSSLYGGSGAQNPDLAYALIHYFKYNPNVRNYSKAFFKPNEWERMIHNELENGRPVIYTGRGQTTTDEGKVVSYGHAFVLDGCDSDGLYHINWGYNGDSDGFFELTALAVGNSSFNLDQAMVCNITPEPNGEKEETFFADQFGFVDWLNDKTVGEQSTSNYIKDVFCYDVRANTYNKAFEGEIGIGLFDSHLNYIKTLTSSSVKLNAHYGYSTKTFSSFRYDAETFTEGSRYNVAAYVKGKNTEKPTIIRTTNGTSTFYNTLVENGKVKVGLGQMDTTIVLVTPKEGRYKASASDVSNLPKEWYVHLVKDVNDTTVYWLSNIDPAANEKKQIETPLKVHGKMDEMGNIVIPISNQDLPTGLVLNNYSSTGNITVSIVSETEMRISDAWGFVDNSSDEIVTRYTNTQMLFSDEPDVLDSPVILVNDNVLSMSCATEGADIYYSFTQEGAEPSVLYERPFDVTHNGIINAIAKKDGKQSDVSSEKIDWFVVPKPTIVEDGVTISITCPVDSAVIFYTTDGTKPTVKNGKLYTEPFLCAETATIMAFAVLENWNDSEIDTLYHVVIPEPTLVVTNNNAGELSTHITYAQKLTSNSLKVSGYLNGTDIKFIREMIKDGKLAYLDIKDATIVAGGEAYYQSYSTAYTTENDTIGGYMFYYCDGLVSLKLPSSATVINSWAIYNCSNLKILELPVACREIKNYAIQSCKTLETLEIPESLESIGQSNLSGCSKLETITVNASNTHFIGIDGVLYQGDSILVRYPMGKTDIGFIVPSTVKVVGNYAFENALFEEVTMPESVQSIGSSAFSSCQNLKRIVVPNSVIQIGSMAFYNCKKLSEVTMSSEVTKLESMLFYGCKSLRGYHVGANICDIENSTFDGCTSLQRFDVDDNNAVYAAEDGILYIKDMRTLKRCPEALYAETLRIPDGVEAIDSHAFDGCGNIGSFVLPATLKSIGSSAFSGCGMTSISIPSSVTSISSMAFYGCDKLETFVIPTNTTAVSSMMLYGCKKLNYLYVPSDVVAFGSSALSGCKSLSVIDSKIKDIENVEVAYSTYSGEYTPFDNIPDTCTWRVPAGPANDIEKYARKYKEQPWWVSTWRIVIDKDIEPVNITMTDSVMTFCSIEDLDFKEVNGLKAYIASGFNPATNELLMLHVTEVPARTGLVLKGTADNTYAVPVTDTEFVYSNLLVGVLNDTDIDVGYVLNEGQFAIVNGTETVKAGEAYLNLTGATANRVKMIFVEPEGSGIETIQQSLSDRFAWYTLQGVRLQGKPTQQGIYLHQGRKVTVK